MKFKAVLFDLDGTLLDTLRDLADCCNRVLCGMALPQHDRAAYRYFVGDGREALVARILPLERRDPDTIAEVAAAFDHEYNLHWADTTCPYGGIPDLLDALALRGVRLSVVSNKPDESVRIAVSEMLPKWRFEVVLGARPAVPKKPDPASAVETAHLMGLSAADFLYVGDTDIDMKTARAAGMAPVGALWGFRTADELLAGGAGALIGEPLDLLSLL